MGKEDTAEAGQNMQEVTDGSMKNVLHRWNTQWGFVRRETQAPLHPEGEVSSRSRIRQELHTSKERPTETLLHRVQQREPQDSSRRAAKGA